MMEGALGRIVVSFFVLLVLVSSKFSASAQGFTREPELYFDLGHGSHDGLTSEVKRELLELLFARIQYLEGSLSRPRPIEEAVNEVEANLKNQKRWHTRMVALSCGVVGACLAGFGFYALLPAGTLQQLGPMAQAVVGFQGLLWGINAGALGYAIVASREMAEPPREPILYLDLRSRSILNAAQDLSAQMRAMAIPLSFWSLRRFRDFTVRLIGFQALEQLIEGAEFEDNSDFAKSLRISGTQKKLVDDEWAQDMSDVQKKKISLRALRELQRLELATLKVMMSGMEELVGPLSIEAWSEADCMDLLKTYLSHHEI